ncbi:MAG: YbaK/EbsC family protein [Propionibacterium sp.]|nr:YbaK/EbsC family protein [Propionibacterium sp.]
MSDQQPNNPALEALAASGLDHRVVRHGRVNSLQEAAEIRGVEPGQIVKSMVVKTGNVFGIVLVPGLRKISWPKFRAALEVNKAAMPSAEEAKELTGFERGTITPFGTKTKLPVIADERIGPGDISIGAGDHGVSVTLDAGAMFEYLNARLLDVTDEE